MKYRLLFPTETLIGGDEYKTESGWMKIPWGATNKRVDETGFDVVRRSITFCGMDPVQAMQLESYVTEDGVEVGWKDVQERVVFVGSNTEENRELGAFIAQAIKRGAQDLIRSTSSKEAD